MVLGFRAGTIGHERCSLGGFAPGYCLGGFAPDCCLGGFATGLGLEDSPRDVEQLGCASLTGGVQTFGHGPGWFSQASQAKKY